MAISNCPLCNSANFSQIYVLDVSILVHCLNCTHIYSIAQNELNLVELYSTGDYQMFDARETIIEKIINLENRIVFKKIKKIKKTGKSLLDFGCGKGKFLYVVKNNYWKVKGIETSQPRAEYGMKNYGLVIDTKNYNEGLIDGGPFDVITLFHVLEHIPKPTGLITNLIKTNLKNHGLIVIEVPNYNSWQSRIGKSNWLHLDLPRHISHFTIKNINNLLLNQKVSIKKIEYFSLISGILGMSNSIMNIFGYKKNIISELKYHRTLKLLLMLFVVLPISCVLEIIASLFNAGGIIRIFVIKNNDLNL